MERNEVSLMSLSEVWIDEYMEYFRFGDYSTKAHGWYVTVHNAPTPKEKEILASVPFMQGVYDFSYLLGERIFENRTIKIELLQPLVEYSERKQLEIDLKTALMSNEILPIEDSYLRPINAHWLGKCVGIDFRDDEKTWTLKAIVEFDCYPLAIQNARKYSDVFDEEYFTDGVDQWTGFNVKYSRNILLFNAGLNALSPTIESNSNMQVRIGDEIIEVMKGTNKDKFVKLKRGMNEIGMKGTGHISFTLDVEVMA